MRTQIYNQFARWLIPLACFLSLALVFPRSVTAQKDPSPQPAYPSTVRLISADDISQLERSVAGNLLHDDWQAAGSIPAFNNRNFFSTGKFNNQSREIASIAWSDIVNLGSGYFGQDAIQTRVLSDNHGALHAIWSAALSDAYTLDSKVFYATKPVSGNWTNPLPISGDSVADMPDIAVDPSNNLYAVWHGSGTFFAYKPHDGAWTEPVRIFEDTGLAWPRIKVDASGKIHLIGPDINGIEYATRTNGNWSALNPISTDKPLTNPCMAIDSKGTIHVLWQKAAAGWNIYYLNKTINGQWTSPQQISWEGGWSADLAIDSKDTLYAVWENPLETAYVGFREKPAGGDWSDLEKIDSAVRTFAPKIIANNANIELVYARLGSLYERYRIVYKEKKEGTNWSDGIPLTSELTSSLGHSLTSDPFGRTHVLWFNILAPGLQYNVYGEIQFRQTAHSSYFLFLPDINR